MNEAARLYAAAAAITQKQRLASCSVSQLLPMLREAQAILAAHEAETPTYANQLRLITNLISRLAPKLRRVT